MTLQERAAESLKLADLLNANPDISGAHSDEAVEMFQVMAADITALCTSLKIQKEAGAKAAEACVLFVQAISKREREIEGLKATLSAAAKGLQAVESLIDASHGVYGLHINGDPSPWSELREGGYFEAWLIDFDTALDAIGADQQKADVDD